MIDIIFLSKEKKIIVELGDLSFINNLLSSLDISYQLKVSCYRLSVIGYLITDNQPMFPPARPHLEFQVGLRALVPNI